MTGDVAAPVIPKGKGSACVADTDYMRRNHPELLSHQRDDTVRLGIRGAKFSLMDCVECHAVPGPDGRAVSVNASKQFCSTCHEYAAVQIDCFECHASKPSDKSKAAAKATVPPKVAVVEMFRTEQR